jgi:hypothetical protein
VYPVGLFQGLSLVASPAAASILQLPTGYDLSKNRYGLLFLPQVTMAITASLAMPTFARRFGLLAGITANTVAMGLLVASEPLRTDAIVLVFALGGFACSGFFPMTVGYGETPFPTFVELAAGWLIVAYQVGYGLVACGGRALQRAVPLATIFRVAAALAVVMAFLAIPIARRQHIPNTSTFALAAR